MRAVLLYEVMAISRLFNPPELLAELYVPSMAAIVLAFRPTPTLDRDTLGNLIDEWVHAADRYYLRQPLRLGFPSMRPMTDIHCFRASMIETSLKPDFTCDESEAFLTAVARAGLRAPASVFPEIEACRLGRPTLWHKPPTCD